MEVKRGDIVLASGPGEYSRKPRPFLIVQSNAFNPTHASISLCPITSIVSDNYMFRVRLDPSAENGLRRTSDIQIDKVQSLQRGRLKTIIGSASVLAMRQVDETLRQWLNI